MDKNLAFEYFVSKLLVWYQDVTGNVQNNDFSTLKVLKLLFFASAVGTEKGQEDTLLDTTFNRFYAMPYGHVESEIYSTIRNNELPNLRITNSSSTFTNNITYLDCELKNKIDSSIEKLKEENINLIKMSPFELVELSHNWYSWKFYFNKAKRNGSYSELIPSEIIKSEQKFFHL
ncbi:type II toxin-antitoxin system antitoxin SocA domain-containing protein [Flavobacterium columnare]|uniref:type II toxin-antitoxin system antitoxin SocA domain-containing protein n=1 Tax=Flavobacterium columnare TaxID=996 RepID=UPI000D1B514D|nr:type II toxin-antitoxin system antitoxin SocA domain-containing protein [Flavobacterium columnare]PTD14383.1 hypothetical protein C6N29_08000 [Flavobacterium columnare]